MLLLRCLMAEPGHIRKAASRSLVSGLLCVSHHLEVAFICFNLTALGSSGEHCHHLSFLPLQLYTLRGKGAGCRVLCNKALSPHHLFKKFS